MLANFSKSIGLFVLCIFWSCSDAAMHAIESYRFYLNGHGERWILLSLLAANIAVLIVWLFSHWREHKETIARNQQIEDALTSPFAHAFYNVITFDLPFRHVSRVAFKLDDSPAFKAEFERVGRVSAETITAEVRSWNAEAQRKNLSVSYALASEEPTSQKSLAKIEKHLKRKYDSKQEARKLLSAVKIYPVKARDDRHTLANIHFPPPYVSPQSEKLDA